MFKKAVCLSILSLALLAAPAQADPPTQTVDLNDAAKIEGIISINFTPQTTLGWKSNDKDSWATGLTWLNGATSQVSEMHIYSQGLSGALELSNMHALTRLTARANQLSSLNLGGSTALTHLDVYKNQLSSLDISKNTALTVLDVSDNQLSSLDISKNTALINLNASYNQLSSLDISKNPALTDLNVGDNRLSSLETSANPALQYLYAHNNRLSSLNTSANPALQYLYAHNNRLSSLDISKNPALIELIVSDNQLSSLDISKNPALTYLEVSDNQLSSLDISKNPALQYLFVNDNQLSSLVLGANQALIWLYARNNQLSSLDISKNPSLQRLYVDNNRLRSLDISSNSNLAQLNIAGNAMWLSELYKVTSAPTPPAAYHLGEQNIYIRTRDKVIDLSQELSFAGVDTNFTVADAQGNIMPNAAQNGLVTFNRAGNYTVSMTNAGLASQGSVSVYNPLTAQYESTLVEGWLAQVFAHYTVGAYKDIYGVHNANNAALGGALDKAMDANVTLDAQLDALLQAADQAASPAIFNQASAEQLALGSYAVMQGAAKPFMAWVDNLAGYAAHAQNPQQSAAGGILLASLGKNSDAPLGYYPQETPWRIHYTALGGWGKNKGADGIQGYDLSRYGTFLSLDYSRQGFMLGGAFTYTQSNVDYDNWGSESEAGSTALALYGRYNLGQYFVGGQLGLGYASVENTRKIPAAAAVAESEYDMYWCQAALTAGRDFALGQSTHFVPKFGLAYLRSQAESFSEKKAGALNLKVDKQDINSFELQATLDAHSSFDFGNRLRITPRAKIGLAYELADENATIKARFSQMPNIGSFDGESGELGRLRFIGGLNLDVNWDEPISLTLHYATSLQKDYSQHQAAISLKITY